MVSMIHWVWVTMSVLTQGYPGWPPWPPHPMPQLTTPPSWSPHTRGPLHYTGSHATMRIYCYPPCVPPHVSWQGRLEASDYLIFKFNHDALLLSISILCTQFNIKVTTRQHNIKVVWLGLTWPFTINSRQFSCQVTKCCVPSPSIRPPDQKHQYWPI